jgi:hypothetical protein
MDCLNFSEIDTDSKLSPNTENFDPFGAAVDKRDSMLSDKVEVSETSRNVNLLGGDFQ